MFLRLSKIFLVIFFAAFASASLYAQDSLECNQNYLRDSLLEKLAGQCHLAGQIGKRPVKNNFSASWVLNHQFLELNFTDVADPPTYAAKVLIGYDCTSGRYVAHWLDILGGRFSETLGYGAKSGDTITLRFDYPDGPFLNRMTYNRAANTWQLHMTRKDGDQWVLFGDEYLKKD